MSGLHFSSGIERFPRFPQGFPPGKAHSPCKKAVSVQNPGVRAWKKGGESRTGASCKGIFFQRLSV